MKSASIKASVNLALSLWFVLDTARFASSKEIAFLTKSISRATCFLSSRQCPVMWAMPVTTFRLVLLSRSLMFD